jgi:hypothetical protein
LIREQASFIFLQETCTHGLVVESSFTINEVEPYHDQTNLKVQYEVNEEEKMLREKFLGT